MPDSPVNLEPGQTVQNISLSIDDPSTLPSSGNPTLVLQAYSNDAYQQEFGETPADN